MLPDDAIRSRLQATVESLRYWVPTIADVARVAERERPDAWTFIIGPNIASACPVDVTLHSGQQFDLVIAGEAYEGRTAASFDLILPLLEAVTEGRVVQRHWVSLATGAPRAIETIVTLGDGSIWRDGRTIEAVAGVIPREATERHDRHFLPYRRST
jgi:hypothetical protein